MFSNRHILRIVSGIAGIAILFATLAPSLSQAAVARKIGKNGWAEICTVYGLQVVQTDGGHASPASQVGDASGHFERCPFCPINPVYLPTPSAKAVYASETVLRAAALHGHALTPVFVQHGKQARAPPIFS